MNSPPSPRQTSSLLEQSQRFIVLLEMAALILRLPTVQEGPHDNSVFLDAGMYLYLELR